MGNTTNDKANYINAKTKEENIYKIKRISFQLPQSAID